MTDPVIVPFRKPIVLPVERVVTLPHEPMNYSMTAVDLELAQQSLIEALRHVLSCRFRLVSCPLDTQQAFATVEEAVSVAQDYLKRDIQGLGELKPID